MTPPFTHAVPALLRRALGVLAVPALLLAATPAQAGLVTMPTGLHAGDTFRVVFITSVGHDALSSQISDYDLFVSGLAAAAGIDSYFGAPVAWQALASTHAVNAIDRVGLDSAGLYLGNGARVADDGADLWDGTLDNPIVMDERGNFREGQVFTGTRSNGFAAADPLGGAAIQITEIGLAGIVFTNQFWVSLGAGSGATARSLYAVSSELTVPGEAAPIAEPPSLALVATAFAFAGAVRARRRPRGKPLAARAIPWSTAHPRRMLLAWPKPSATTSPPGSTACPGRAGIGASCWLWASRGCWTGWKSRSSVR